MNQRNSFDFLRPHSTVTPSECGNTSVLRKDHFKENSFHSVTEISFTFGTWISCEYVGTKEALRYVCITVFIWI